MENFSNALKAATGFVSNARRMAGGVDGTLANWRPRRIESSGEAQTLDRAMVRAESLVENDGHAASAIQALALNTVGAGMRPQSYPDASALGITDEAAADFAESAENAWEIWADEADAAGVLHFGDVQYRAMRSMLVTGEALHLALWREDAGRTFGLCLQAVHPARLRTPSDMNGDAMIRAGVQLGAYGEPLGYWIANPPAGRSLAGLASGDFQYVQRKAGHRWLCLHTFHAGMPEQVRGVSVLSPAMKQFRDLADYVDYELVGACIAASLTLFLEVPPDVLGAGAGFKGENNGQSADYGQLQPGTMMMGQPGQKPHVISSTRPGPTFDAFYERVLRAAAASTGQPYEMVAKDFSKTNYSSARAALLEVWKLYTLHQEHFIHGFLGRLWPMVVEEAWARGLLKVPAGAPDLFRDPLTTRAWLRVAWTRPPRGQIDPVKERVAEQHGLDAYTETRTAICHARGIDFETVARTRQREDALLARLGLKTTPPAETANAAAEEEEQADA